VAERRLAAELSDDARWLLGEESAPPDALEVRSVAYGEALPFALA
jgi:hypothetical protein